MATLVRSTFSLVGFVGIFLILNPVLVLIVAFAIVPHLYMQLHLGTQRMKLAVGNSPKERRALYYGSILSSVEFAKEIRLFNLADFFMGWFRRNYEEIHTAQRSQQMREARWQVIANTIAAVVSTTALVIVILQAFAGQLSMGDVSLYMNGVTILQTVLMSFAAIFATANESVLFYSHFTNLLAMPQPLPSARVTKHVPTLSTDIEFRNVSFRYGEEHPWVLRNVNLTIRAGECLALVGLNGAGKTTLAKLLARLYDPVEGNILWDGIDIRDFDPVEYREHIGVIFQDFTRFELSAKLNIGVGQVAAIEDVDLVRRAAREAGIDDVVGRLPRGYETILSLWLSEDGQGVGLSGGEWQKIGLARMFMRTSALLMLDEPTAALDAQAEYDLYQQFIKLIPGRTSLLISHRFSTVRVANSIAVLMNGEIVERGCHAELMELRGSYSKLYKLQAEQYRDAPEKVTSDGQEKVVL